MFVFGRNTEVVAPRIAVVVPVILQTVITGVAKKYGALVNVIELEVEITTTATKTTTMVIFLGNTSTTRCGAAWWIETVSLAKNL
jgi:hypothetical protein